MPSLEVPAGLDRPLTGHLPMGEPENRDDAIAVTSRYLTRGGRPWLPILGEFHFSRYPAAEWAEELRKIRAGGITLVATYLIWNLHEERRGRYDFSGDRDVRAFVRACADAGLEVVMRVGPWAHGESRNGGFPDWLLAEDVRPRTDDPGYLDLVRPYLAEIAARLRGLGRADGGPIVAVQIENELYDQPEHLRTLKRMVREAGLDAPLWTATGWGHAQLPEDEFLPVFGGYSEAAWDTAHDGWPQQSRAHYFFGPGRDDDSIGADLRTADAAGGTTGAPTDEVHLARYPFATCELGGGMYTSYHRRPIVEPDDLAALALVKLGSGSSLQGYYLYHGASQKIGASSTLQESHATGYPNDCPVINYDFQAPLGEAGQFRESWFVLRRQHLWLADHGARLAPMVLHLPADAPDDTADTETLRWAVRADADSGYLFVNNHQPVETLPEHAGVQFTVRLGGRDLVVPRRPVTIRAGHYFAWPLNQPVGPARIVTATAQPLLDLVVDGVPTAVLGATAGIAVELVLDAAAVDGPGDVAPEDGRLVVTGVEPGPDALLRITGADGDPAAILVLDEASALRATRGRLWGRDRLVVSAAPVVLAEGLAVSYGPAAPLLVYPAVDGHRRSGVFSVYEPDGRPVDPVPAAVTRLRDAGPARRPVIDPASSRASAPVDDDFAAAAVLHVPVPDDLFDVPDDDVPDEEVLLRVHWTGDVGRAYVDGRLIADQFYHGPVWDIPLRRHRKEAVAHGIELRLLPLAEDAPVFLSPSARPASYPPGGALDVREVHFVRQPRTVLAGPGEPR